MSCRSAGFALFPNKCASTSNLYDAFNFRFIPASIDYRSLDTLLLYLIQQQTSPLIMDSWQHPNKKSKEGLSFGKT